MTFASLGLIEPLLRMLDTIGYTEPTPIQQQAIPAVLAGRDVLAAAQTGTGKTAGFAIPLIQRLAEIGERAAPGMVRCLVLTPTRELAEQVFESFRSYGRNVPMRAHVVYGGVPIEPQIAKLRKGLDVMVATPGRLLDLYHQGVVQFDQLQAVVLDEADRMLDLGFANDLEAILLALPDEKQTLLFSATFSSDIRDLAQILLEDPVTLQASPRNAAAATVRQWAITTDKKSKPDLFLHLLRQQGWGQVLVFVKTRKGADLLLAQLHEAGASADSIHGDKSQPARLRALGRFKSGQVQILVATDVAARGLDIEALPLVVNFDVPIVAEDYVHRIGRTGRAGMDGEALSLVCADEVELLRALEKLTRQVLPRTEIPGFLAEHRVPETAPAAKPAAAKSAAAKGKSGPKKAGSRSWSDSDVNGKEGTDRGDKRQKPPKLNVDPEQAFSDDPRFSTAATRFQNPVTTKAPPAGPRGAGSGARAKPSFKQGPRATAPAIPKGAVVVTGGRGSKSAARATGQATAKAATRRGPKR